MSNNKYLYVVNHTVIRLMNLLVGIPRYLWAVEVYGMFD